MASETKVDIAESICDQVKKILEINLIKKVNIQISIDFSGESFAAIPIVNAQIETFAPVLGK